MGRNSWAGWEDMGAVDALLAHRLATSTSASSAPRPLVTLPGLRLVSEANIHDHWRKRLARSRLQRQTTFYTLRCSGHLPPALPVVVTITRIAPRALDDDNLQSACKFIRDGIADWLAGAEGQGEDRQPGLCWRYAQRAVAPRTYGVEIHLTFP